MKTFRIKPRLPQNLAPLQTIAGNLYFSWMPDTIDLFKRIDVKLWESCNHNPVLMLGSIPQERLTALSEDAAFLAHMERVHTGLNEYLKSSAWFQHKHPGRAHGDKPFRVAYFSMEFGLHESLPVYSGGLGVLAGDHLKSSSELGIPLVGIGLLYQEGYFRQYLNPDGWQGERYPENDFYNLPIHPVLDADGNHIDISVEFPGRLLYARLWRVQVGRIPLLLLDTNFDKNSKDDQTITDRLYGGDSETRIQQEILLGIGGMRALEAAGFPPTVCHMNEGHAAFLGFERTRQVMAQTGLNYEDARLLIKSANIFTTHTPVPAGFDLFDRGLVEKYFGFKCGGVGLNLDQFMAYGRTDGDTHSPLNMALFALRHSSHHNAVSELHGEVSRRMFQSIWKDFPVDELPLGHVTNGIHTRTWISPGMTQLLNRHLGTGWLEDPADDKLWNRLDSVPDEELWRVHTEQRERLVYFARHRLAEQLARRGAPENEIREARGVLGTDTLTIGFARRFATYKRANLLLRDADRLLRLLADEDRPLQIIFAGKAHPHDNDAKQFIREIHQFSRRPDVRGRFVFLEDYDMNIARHLVQGVDVWLNTPRRPREASGTSGMKVSANGGLNLSVLDGWWCEGYNPDTGWAIGTGPSPDGEEWANYETQDEIEANALYEILESDIVPLFYNRRQKDRYPFRWLQKMKRSMRALCPVFNTNRMVLEYCEKYYMPAEQRFQQLCSDHAIAGKESLVWRKRVQQEFGGTRVLDFSAPPAEMAVGDAFEVTAHVTLGKLQPEDVTVQLYHGNPDPQGALKTARSQVMRLQKLEGDRLTYVAELACKHSGLHSYTVRIVPHHAHVDVPADLSLATWADGERPW
jgi:glycogen phosphorylase